VISRNLRVLNGISHLKENERVLRGLAMKGLVNKIHMTELQSWLHGVEQFAKRRAANRIAPASRCNATAKPVLTSTTVRSPATVHGNLPQ
jgi:hypothetical protein